MNNYTQGRLTQPSGGYGSSVSRPTGRKKITLTKENYVETADKVMQELVKTEKRLTTTKIRNLLSMVSDLYNGIRREHSQVLNSDWVSRIQYVRMHFAYEAGREPSVKKFIDQADLMDVIKDIGTSREKLILFCHYMEALVAYHRFYDGKDK